MEQALYTGTIEQLRERNRLLLWAVAGAVLTALVEAIALLQVIGSERQHFVPPEITRPFWIAGGTASAGYFEDMALFLHGLSMNVTPESAQAACKQYLGYVQPADRNLYQQRCDATAARLKRDNASQLFAVSELATNAVQRTVELDGTLTTLIGDKPFKEKQRYRMVFDYQKGRFYVSEHLQLTEGRGTPR